LINTPTANAATVKRLKKGINQLPRGWDAFYHVLFIMLSVIAVLPVIMVFIVSFSSYESVVKFGYRLIPAQWSLEAYDYVFADGMRIVRAYGVTLTITVCGTLGALLITSLFAYPLARSSFPYKKIFAGMVLIPMLFSGGMTASYLVYTTILGLRNNLFALILPCLFNGFSAFIMRTYFKANISDSLIESAFLDGAGELTIFTKIVMPLSKPILATIGFQTMLGQWNEWFGSMLYMTDPHKYSVQYLLTKILRDALFIKNNLSMLGGYGFQQLANMPTESMRMALSVITMLPILFAYPFFQKYFVRGMTLGSLKG
jgi:putative aldouronate transport system permease protein